MNQYFASLGAQDLVKELGKKIQAFNLYCDRVGWSGKWKRSHDLYYGKHLGETGVSESTISQAGSDGELNAFGVNHYRNLIKHVMSMTTSQKPSYDPKAVNSDTKAMQQTRLSANILDYYMSEKRMGRHMVNAAERALVFSKGFVYMDWDRNIGKPYVVDQSGRILKEGDIAISAKSPKDVIFDPAIRDWEQNNWVIVRCFENKWDLAARNPKQAEEIIKISAQDDLDTMMNGQLSMSAYLSLQDKDQGDIVSVYKFYHKGTDSLPQGRCLTFLNGEIVLEDGPAKSKAFQETLPTFRITPGDVFDSAEGYSEAFDTMVLQQVANILYNIPFNNQQAFGIHAIWMPDGCELSSSQIGKGLALLKGGPPGSQPIPLQLTRTPEEIFKNIQVIENVMTKMQGLNSVVTGDPDHNLKSGAALGRMQAMAIQFNSNFQKSWAELQEDCGTFLLKLIQDNANTKRVVAIGGKANKGAMASFDKSDLDLISHVVVDLGNPMARTAAGRLEMAETLLEKGGIDAKQYIQIAMTGQLDSELEGKESQQELMKKENELLMDGKPVRAIVGDAHMTHASEHMAVISDPNLRTLAASGDQLAEQILQATLNHIQEHIQLYQTQPPEFSAIAGEQPAPPPPPPQGPPPGPEQAPPPQAGEMPPPPPVPDVPPPPQALPPGAA